MTRIDKRLDDIEQRLMRLERLAFLGFQDTRRVAEYAYENLSEDDPETVKQLSWKDPNFRPLQDSEVMAGAGLSMYELAALKMAVRLLRRQVRQDVLGIVGDIVRRSLVKEEKKEEAA